MITFEIFWNAYKTSILLSKRLIMWYLNLYYLRIIQSLFPPSRWDLECHNLFPFRPEDTNSTTSPKTKFFRPNGIRPHPTKKRSEKRHPLCFSRLIQALFVVFICFCCWGTNLLCACVGRAHAHASLYQFRFFTFFLKKKKTIADKDY